MALYTLTWRHVAKYWAIIAWDSTTGMQGPNYSCKGPHKQHQSVIIKNTKDIDHYSRSKVKLISAWKGATFLWHKFITYFDMLNAIFNYFWIWHTHTQYKKNEKTYPFLYGMVQTLLSKRESGQMHRDTAKPTL